MSLSNSIAALVTALECAPDRDAWRATFRERVGELCTQLPLHPSGPNAADLLEQAARTTRLVAASNLPLGLGFVMHLYPLCALSCVPLPRFSVAHWRRARLLKCVHAQGWLLANAGSERAAGAHAPVRVTRLADGLRIDGTFEYVSLASVARLVLFSAPLGDSGKAVFCAADLLADGVRIGEARFGGGMALSDTCAVTFTDHRIPAQRFIEIPGESTLHCMANYQRSWFHLLLAEAYLARLLHLQREHRWSPPAEQLASLHELACLREYAAHLLNQGPTTGVMDSLLRTTTAIKLRTSWLAQATAQALEGRDPSAHELRFMRLQPTSDERIIRNMLAGSVHQPLEVHQWRHALRAGGARGAHLAKAAT